MTMPRQNPRRPDSRTRSVMLAMACVRLREPAEAAAAAHEAVALGEGDAGTAYNTACLLSLCVPLVPDRPEAARYADEAMATLTKAVAAGWDDAAQTAADPDLTPLHGRDDFRRLVAGLFDRAFPADPFRR